MRISALAPTLLLAATLLPASAALAQDMFVYGGAALQFAIEPDGAGSQNKTDLNGYVELEKAGFYGGIWAEFSNQSVANEVDLYLGYRGEAAGGLGYDFGYTRYYYPKDGGDCCGELTASLSQGFGDQFSGTLDLAYDPEARLGNAYVGLSYAAADKLSVSANYGTYQVDGAGAEQEWDFGVGYALGEETAVDLRYYDGTDYPSGYVGLELSWDTTILSR